MRVELNPLFGLVPDASRNLVIVGSYKRRFEEQKWATVWPVSGVVRWANREIEPETIWVPENLRQCGDYHSIGSLFPKVMLGRYFNLSLYYGGFYYHWVCDVLTRLHGVLPAINEGFRVIAPPQLAAWQLRSLELIGIAPEKLLAYSGRRPYKVETLYYASPVAMTGDHEASSLLWLRDTIKIACLGGGNKLGWRKLFLARRSTWSRNLMNEAEVMSVLEKHGYETVDCAALTFDQQVRLFSEAECVIGIHGAALTNVLWAPPGARVLEIFEPTAVRRCYWSMCRALGHKYSCAVGESVANPGREPNLRVNVSDLARAVDGLVG